MTFDEIGEIFGVTRERIRQIEAKALRRLRWGMTNIASVILWNEKLDMWVEKLTVEQRILVMGEENYKRLVEWEDKKKKIEEAKYRKKWEERNELIIEVQKELKKKYPYLTF